MNTTEESETDDFPPHYTRAIDAIDGWLALDDPTEALAELQRLDRKFQNYPSVTLRKTEIYWKLKDFPQAIVASQALVDCYPDKAAVINHHALILRASGALEKGYRLLLDSSAKFPSDPMTHYNLACFACNLGEFHKARPWLEKAIELDGELVAVASMDLDLEPIRDVLEGKRGKCPSKKHRVFTHK